MSLLHTRKYGRGSSKKTPYLYQYFTTISLEVIKLLSRIVFVYLSSKANHKNNHSRCFSLDLFLRALWNVSSARPLSSSYLYQRPGASPRSQLPRFHKEVPNGRTKTVHWRHCSCFTSRLLWALPGNEETILRQGYLLCLRLRLLVNSFQILIVSKRSNFNFIPKTNVYKVSFWVNSLIIPFKLYSK